jgi:D-glycero-alpha-D-manno-heptose-7-phosphate kinase
MIITRTPFRISFFGGGTDYPVWYRENGGAVLSTTINKYCYISCRYLPPFFDNKYLIRYSQREATKRIDEIQHPSVRECLNYLDMEKGVEMVHTADIPAKSGIASSSAFTVGFLHALYALKGQIVTKRQLAREAIHVEQNLIKESVGSQDQVAVAFGGFNRIDFGGDGDFYVTPVTIAKEKIDLLQDHMLLFFTGFARNSSDIAGEQIKKTPEKKYELLAMKEIVDEAIEIFRSNADIKDFGRLLHESWKLKRSLTNLISTGIIDAMYESAIGAGAIGGKLLGAGGGGFLLLFAPPEKHQAIKDKLNLLNVPFRFENLGSQIILYSGQDFS